MSNQDLNSSASKFITSLVKSLQIICNGHVDFSESIELIGHINVRIDHKLKFDYIVDEHVTKKGADCSTTFLSNSYQSSPPSQTLKDDNFERANSINMGGLPAMCPVPQTSKTSGFDIAFRDGSQTEDCGQPFAVNVESARERDIQESPMVFKLEGDGDSAHECMALSTPTDNFLSSKVGDGIEPLVSEPSGSMEVGLTTSTSRKRKSEDQDLGRTASEAANGVYENIVCIENPTLKDSPQALLSLPNQTIENDEETEKPTNSSADCIKDFKELVTKLASMSSIPVIQDEILDIRQKRFVLPSENDIKAAKKKFLELFDKEKLRKMREVLKMKKGKQKKLRLRALLVESGVSNEQLHMLAQDASIYRRRIGWKSEGPDKDVMLKAHKKSMRIKTQERQQRLLEMAEMLKRTRSSEPGMTVLFKDGGKKCSLHKSSISVVSHNTHQLTVDNIDDVAEALTGKTARSLLLQNKMLDKPKEKIKIEPSRKICIRKKMKQIVGKMLAEVSDAGYRVLVTSTVGSEAGSHSAELSVIPLKVDDFFPENKECEVKPELSEEEYAKQLEREQMIDKQKINEEKMKEIEGKLIRILSGAEEVFIPTRKRFNPGEPRPSDAERMKEYRKRLKQDPEKYQVYKQKRAMNKKWRKLGQLAAKVKVNTPGATLTVIPASVNEEPHNSQPMGTIVNINPPVANVNMHCPQVFEHPPSHQPSASVVNVHHTNQYVGQVSGIHAAHQQPITYSNEMEFVELIAATHNVQNQHFG